MKDKIKHFDNQIYQTETKIKNISKNNLYIIINHHEYTLNI